VDGWLDSLDRAVASGDRRAAERVFEEAIPEFKRRAAAPPPPAPAAPARLASN